MNFVRGMHRLFAVLLIFWGIACIVLFVVSNHMIDHYPVYDPFSRTWVDLKEKNRNEYPIEEWDQYGNPVITDSRTGKQFTASPYDEIMAGPRPEISPFFNQAADWKFDLILFIAPTLFLYGDLHSYLWIKNGFSGTVNVAEQRLSS